MARLLDQYDRIQQLPVDGYRPLGRNFYGGSAGYQYRRLGEAYGRATRMLRREARRGNVNAALGEIKVRQQAMGDGFSPGYIGERGENNASRELWQNTQEQNAADAGLLRSAARRELGVTMGYDPNAWASGQPMTTAGGAMDMTTGQMAGPPAPGDGMTPGGYTPPTGDSRSQFAADLGRSDLIREGNTGAMGRAFRRGEALGLSRNDVTGYLNRSVFDSEPDTVNPNARRLGRRRTGTY